MFIDFPSIFHRFPRVFSWFLSNELPFGPRSLGRGQRHEAAEGVAHQDDLAFARQAFRGGRPPSLSASLCQGCGTVLPALSERLQKEPTKQRRCPLGWALQERDKRRLRPGSKMLLKT